MVESKETLVVTDETRILEILAIIPNEFHRYLPKTTNEIHLCMEKDVLP